MDLNGNKHTPQRLLPLSVVEDRTGYRKSKLYELLKSNGFPQPVRDRRNIRFVEAEVDAWIAARIAERDATVGAVKAVLVTEREAAAALNLSVSWLQKDRLKAAPTVPFVRVGPHVRYDLEAVRAALGGSKERDIDGRGVA